MAGFSPTEKQRELWSIIEQAPQGSLSMVGYGGAAGGGKSRALCELAIDLSLDFPGNRILIGRKDFADLRTTTMEEFYRACPPQLISKKNESEHWCRLRLPEWPEGVESAVYFKELKDAFSLASEEYGAALIDEAGEVPERTMLMIVTRMRHSAAKKRAIICASNPWPGWFERWFIKRSLPEEVLKNVGGSVHFVPSFIKDNPYLPDNYEELLRGILPQDWVDRFVEGRWDAFVGQVHPDLGENHCWNGPLPDFKYYVGGLDFGGQNPYDHMTAGVIAGVTEDDWLIRLAHFEDRGPLVYERLREWRDDWEKNRLRRKVRFVADKSQMWGIDIAKQSGWIVQQSHGGTGSVDIGIGLQNTRFVKQTSFYVPALAQPWSRDAASRGAKAWLERMQNYRWDEPRNEDQEAKKEPIKRDDDTANADRYLHEAVDVWPVSKPVRSAGGRQLASKAV